MSLGTVTLDSRLKPHAEVLSRELSGERVFLHLGTQAYFGLDEVGTRIWNALCAAGTVTEAVAALAGEYDVDRATLTQDVLELASSLVARELLVIAES